MNAFVDRVGQVRSLMRARGWDAVVITGSDPHSSEYVAPRWHQVAWVSGYTGEGDLVITADQAGLWTDSRYFIQATRQLSGTGIGLHKTRVSGEMSIPQWLAEQFSDYQDAVMVVDGLCQTAVFVEEIRKTVGPNATIVSAPDFLSVLWKDRPPVPQAPVITLGTEQVGWSRNQKFGWIRKWMREKGYDAILLSALDEIAWMLNVRGEDVAYNPVVMSYLLVTQGFVQWFVRKGALSGEDRETPDSFRELAADGVSIRDYSEVSFALESLPDGEEVKRLFVDAVTLNYDLSCMLKSNSFQAEVVPGKSPVSLRKAVKNEVEIAGMREAHLEDGLAMERFFFWLESVLAAGDRVNEYAAACKLHSFRKDIPGFRGESFETVSAYGANAALPHYATPEYDSAELDRRGLYLCDSGGQYLFGTTDITRTVPLGPCTPLEREDYTLVLKGHIALARTIFPRGTAGCQIDALARAPLWNSKRNFGHGTGHGVGFYLNVHEGPQDIRQNFNRQPILPGMVTSDEPGIYREGLFGVRHENLLLCLGAGANGFGEWLCFEPLTLCHFDTSILIRDLLEPSEIDWLNAYNARVFEVLSPRLPAEIADWLRAKTGAV